MVAAPVKWLLVVGNCLWAKVNQQPPMHQLVVLSIGWATFFHSAPDGVHHNFFFCYWPMYLFFFVFFYFAAIFPLHLDLTPSYIDHCTFFSLFFLLCSRFPPRLNLTLSYPTHFPPSLHQPWYLYLLSPTNIATLITRYPIDLVTVLATYPINLATLLITYLINSTIVLTTYPTDLATLHTQPLYWHKYFTNLITLIR